MKNIILFCSVIFICILFWACSKYDNSVVESNNNPQTTPPELIYKGNSCSYSGPTSLKTDTVKIVFINEGFKKATANLMKHAGGYSHQDMLGRFEDGYSELHAPWWSTMIDGVWQETNPGESHTWEGTLDPGIYTLVAVRIDPFGVWYGAGLTVSSK